VATRNSQESKGVAFKGEMGHLTSEQIQEFLDRQLTREEEAAAQEHLSACTHCQSEVEAWGLLFSDLGSLPELDPGPAFLHAVLQQAPVREPVGAGARGWLAARKARRLDEAHIPPGSIQDYLEGLLPTQPAARLEAHLASCETCRCQVVEWDGLMESMGPLGHFAPAPGFAERVMAQVMVPSPAPLRDRSLASLPGRAWAWIRSVLPQTRHGWAVAGGVASAPTITLMALTYLVFSRPLMTPGNFGSYLLWKATGLLDSIPALVASFISQSSILLGFFSVLEPVVTSPVLLGLGGLVFSLISAGALWVLYKNLLATPTDDRYARARV
jgi:anti-sigma factor RsiW